MTNIFNTTQAPNGAQAEMKLAIGTPVVIAFCGYGASVDYQPEMRLSCCAALDEIAPLAIGAIGF